VKQGYLTLIESYRWWGIEENI